MINLSQKNVVKMAKETNFIKDNVVDITAVLGKLLMLMKIHFSSVLQL